jgi:hypothetical protein
VSLALESLKKPRLTERRQRSAREPRSGESRSSPRSKDWAEKLPDFDSQVQRSRNSGEFWSLVTKFRELVSATKRRSPLGSEV